MLLYKQTKFELNVRDKMVYVKSIYVSTESVKKRNYLKIYRKTINDEKVLKVYYKMSDGTTEEKTFTDPKQISLPYSFWFERRDRAFLNNFIFQMASKIKITAFNNETYEWMVHTVHKRSYNKELMSLIELQVRDNMSISQLSGTISGSLCWFVESNWAF